MYAIYDKVLEEFKAKGLTREEALAYMETDAGPDDIILRQYRGEWYTYDGQPI